MGQHSAISIKVKEKLEYHIEELRRLNDGAEGELSELSQRVKVLEGLVTVQSYVIQSLALDLSKISENHEDKKDKDLV